MSTITLPNIRVSSDLTVRVRLKDGGVAVDWSTLTKIRAHVYSDAQRALAGRCDVSIDGEDPTVLVCEYAANKPQYLGANRIVVSATYMGETKTYDKPAFSFVRWTGDQEGEEITIDDPDVDVEITVEDVSSSILQEAVDAAFDAADRANDAAAAAEHMVDIHTGPEGKSAYEVAVENGYVGTEEEWLASLEGPVGVTPDISIGTVTTVEPGTPAAASMTGTPEDPVLNLSIPKGLVGATPNITVGTVTTGEPGTPVVVTITGTPEAPVLNLTIPQGMQGNTGSSVEYPYELVNNLTTNDATKGLSAAQGYVLDGKVSQLEHKVDNLTGFIPPESYRGYINTSKQWKDVGFNNRFYKIFPLPDGSKVLNIKASGNSTSYYFLSSYTPTEGETTGVISGQDLTANTEKTELIPATAKYLYVLWLSGTDRTPAKLIVDDVDFLGSLKDAFFDERDRVNDELQGFAKVSVYNPKWIVAGLQISTTGWVYIASTTRVCMRQGQSVHLYPGDVVGFKNYTGKTYYLGWLNASGTYKTGGAWLTADYTVTEEGDYVFCLRNDPETTVSQASDLGDLFFIRSLRERVFANASAISENTEDIAELNTDFQLFRSSVVGGTVNGVNLPFEIGTVFITDTGWNFQPNAQRARIKQGSPLVCKAGDKMSLSNYTLYRMYIGWRVGTTYYYYNGWLTQDFVCPVDGEYEVLVARVSSESDLANVEELSQYFSLKQKGELSELGKIGKTRAIRSVCHQGYSTTSSPYGNNLAEGYVKAAEKGFDYGECDIQFSSDGVPFCCHQTYVGGAWVNAFYDPVAEEYVYFANNTAEQIKEHAYIDADHTVSTFEEVLAACKSVGIGLYIDKIDNITTDAQWSAVFALVKCYAMVDKVVWLIQTTAQGQKVLSFYPNAELSNIQPVLSSAIAGANALKTSANKVSISVSYTSVAVSAIKDVYAQLYAGVEICVYTIDTEEDYEAYLPFVKAITSNTISEPMLWSE